MINRTSFALLALGALLFSALLYAAMTYHVLGWPADTEVEPGVDPRILIALYTIAFGLPCALHELTRRTNILKVIFLLVLIPARSKIVGTRSLCWLYPGTRFPAGSLAGYRMIKGTCSVTSYSPWWSYQHS